MFKYLISGDDQRTKSLDGWIYRKSAYVSWIMNFCMIEIPFSISIIEFEAMFISTKQTAHNNLRECTNRRYSEALEDLP